MSATAPAVESDVHALQCMEVWGGNQAINNAVSVPGIDAWVASEVYHGDQRGGDVHYVSMCGAGKISRFLLADVSGHGEHVGQLTDALRKMMRKNINTVDQTRFTRALNEQFKSAESVDAGMFATALISSYFAPTDHLVVTNAGHPRPLWFRQATGGWQLLDEEVSERVDEVANLPLGIIEPTQYSQFAVQLGKGDLVVIYTDSLLEAKSPDGRQIGEAGLLELVARLDAGRPETFAQSLIDALAEYRAGEAPDDDQTMIVLHHNAADPPKQSLGDMVCVMGKMIGIGH